ncbi:unnamed protein product, partial [Mesorhabditis spiculigera]
MFIYILAGLLALSNAHRFVAPFLDDVSEAGRKEFRDIISDQQLSREERDAKVATWLDKQSQETKAEFLKFREFRNNQIRRQDEYQEALKALPQQVQAAVREVKQVQHRHDLATKEKQAQIAEILGKLSDDEKEQWDRFNDWAEALFAKKQ